MKKTYLKPETNVVVLQHRTTLLTGSLKSVGSNLKDDEAIDFEDETLGEGFLGR